MNNRAVLLANLGSPKDTDVASVRAYLNQFLMDKAVIQLPWFIRRMIVSLFVLPSRPKESAKAYKQVWMKEGSPLVVLSKRLLSALQKQTEIPIAMSMRYGEPSIESELLGLAQNKSIKEILFIPLYPHYADSTVKTSIEEAKRIITKHKLEISLKIFAPFFDEPSYIDALVKSAEPWLNEEQQKNKFDHLLFSYHGLPELHITKADPTGNHCLKNADCCKTPSPAHATCYRHQVFKTTQCFVEKAGLREDQFSIAFQSRLGRAKWLEPSTEQTLVKLASDGIKNLLVICPAFVTDCLETLEEIEIRGNEIFQEAGGESLTLIPCLNEQEVWVTTLANWINNPL